MAINNIELSIPAPEPIETLRLIQASVREQIPEDQAEAIADNYVSEVLLAEAIRAIEQRDKVVDIVLKYNQSVNNIQIEFIEEIIEVFYADIKKRLH